MKPQSPSLAQIIVVAVVCFLAARIATWISFGHPYAAPLWPSVGVALGAMLLLGGGVWPGVLLATFLANLSGLPGRPSASGAELAMVSAGLSAGQTFQALIGCRLVKQFAGGSKAFEQPRSIFLYVAFAGVVGGAIGATISTLCLLGSGWVPTGDLAFLASSWWLGSLCSVVVITPLILAFSRFSLPQLKAVHLGEFGVLLLLLVFTCNVVFGDLFAHQTEGTLAFLLIPLLLWAALRCGRRGTATAVLLLSTLAIYATVNHSGPFAVADPKVALVLLQCFIAIVALMSFIVQADGLERREAVAALQSSEHRYRELFESNPEPMWVYDDETLRFLAVNAAAVQNYGYSREQFLNMILTELRVPEANRPAAELEEKPAGQKIRPPSPCRHRKRNGEIIDVETTRHGLTMEGKGASLVLSSDVTERKRMENRGLAFSRLGRRLSAVRTPKEAAAIMLEAAEALFRWDACVFELYLPELDKAINVICVDTVNGKRQEVTPDDPVRPIDPAAAEALQGPKLILRPSNSSFPEGALAFGDKTRPSASLMYVPVKNDEKIIGSLSLQSYTPNAFNEADLNTLQALADHCAGALERIRAESENERLNLELRQKVEQLCSLTEELEQRVQERTSQLEAINKELEAFSYSVSHDLRAPLRSIRGFTEVLLERYSTQLDARGQEFLRRVCQSSQQMDKLIEDLLKLSRAGRTEMRVRCLDLSAIAESIITELRKNEPERAVEVKIEPGLKACADERLLKVALDNLLQNAWKFSSKQPQARIEIGLTDGTAPAFFVRDNGAGFDMAFASRLFGVFQRLHTSSEFPGTGVGLATAQRIINRHGGRIWAEGQIDQGACFYFTLPAHESC